MLNWHPDNKLRHTFVCLQDYRWYGHYARIGITLSTKALLSLTLHFSDFTESEFEKIYCEDHPIRLIKIVKTCWTVMWYGKYKISRKTYRFVQINRYFYLLQRKKKYIKAAKYVRA